ncbi:hypothetical protein HDG35_003210 [Paraburkholderia sp. JPY681]|nr:hypothetical protein [Paraburkholderia atlantica]
MRSLVTHSLCSTRLVFRALGQDSGYKMGTKGVRADHEKGTKSQNDLTDQAIAARVCSASEPRVRFVGRLCGYGVTVCNRSASRVACVCTRCARPHHITMSNNEYAYQTSLLRSGSRAIPPMRPCKGRGIHQKEVVHPTPRISESFRPTLIDVLSKELSAGQRPSSSPANASGMRLRRRQRRQLRLSSRLRAELRALGGRI